ncbi:AAA family ATPase [Sorangium sp. So ce117]|uniref:AAA family ATPase n=1 Tax=Sorangium sp. So ce117 TaxID=3133277 RepID=UPI003F606163
MDRDILELLTPEDTCTLAGLDPWLFRPREPERDEGWLLGLLEVLAGQRTWEGLITTALVASRDAEALRYAARAEANGVSLTEPMREWLDSRWRALHLTHRRAIDAAHDLLAQVNPHAPMALAMAGEVQQEIEGLQIPGLRPPTLEDLDRALKAESRLQALQEDLKILVGESDAEARQNRDEVRVFGQSALDRLFKVLMAQERASRAPEAQLFRALPDLILCNKTEVLKRIADPGVPLDDLALQVEAAAYLPTAVPPLSHRSPGARRKQAPQAAVPAEIALSATSAAYVKVIKSTGRGIESAKDLQQLTSRIRAVPDLDDAASMWLSVCGVTADRSLSLLALGQGLLAAGCSKLEQRNYRLAIELLRDALLGLAESRHDAAEDALERAVFSLIAAKTWPKYLAVSTGERSRRRIQDWLERPDPMLRWIQENGHIDSIANIWADLDPGPAPDRLLDIIQAHFEASGEFLRACAAAAISAFRLKANTNRSIEQVRSLLAGARPSDELLRALDTLANELPDAIKAKSSTAARSMVKAQLQIIRSELDGSPRDSSTPVDEIAEHLPATIERLLGDLPAMDPDASILPLVKVIYPRERSSGIDLPLLVSNKGAAPVEDLAISVSGPDWGDLGISMGGQPQAEQFIGTLDPDTSEQVTFPLDVPAELVNRITEFKVSTVLQSGRKIVRDREFSVAIRPRDRRSSYSPFSAGSAVTGAQFIGRMKELNRLVGALTGDQPVTPLVVGIRRIGKTSLLKKMMESPEIERRYLSVYWSVDDRPDSDSTVQFFIDLCKKVVDQLPKEARAQLPFSRDEFRREPYSAFEAFTDSLGRLGLHRNVLLVIDEFDRLLQLVRKSTEQQAGDRASQPHEVFQPQVLAALRKVIMKDGPLRMVFAGLPSILSAHYEDRLFGTLDAIELREFSEEEAATVIDEARDVFTVTPQAREKILSATGLQPYLLQLLCHHLFSRMVFSGRDLVAPLDVDHIIEEDLLPHESYFADYVRLVGDYDYILRAVAIAQREVIQRRKYVSINEIVRVLQQQGYNVSAQQARDALQTLHTAGRPLVVRAPNDMTRFRLVIGLLGDYLIRMGRA